MKRALKLITFAAACAVIAGPAAAQQELVVSSFGGEWTDTHRQLVIDGFEKETGAKVRIVSGYSADIMAQLQAQRSNPQMDVVHFSGGQEALAAAEGLLAPIEPEELSNVADMYPISVEGLARGEGPAFAVAAIGVLYNHDELEEAPTSFLDLAKDEFEDRVLLVDISNSYGLLGLLMMNKANGGTLDDIQPGLDFVGDLLEKGADVVKGSPEVRQLFAQGDVVIGPYANDHAYRLKEAGAPITFMVPEEGAAASFLTVNLVAGRPPENRELALKFIDYTLRPEVAAGWAEDARYSPLNRKTELPPEVAGDVVYGEEAINQLVAFDTTKVNEEKPKWIDAWNKLLAQ